MKKSNAKVPLNAASKAAVRRLEKLGARVQWLEPRRRVDISATEIRERAARGLPIDHLVPAGVARVISKEALYTAKAKRKLA
jgi:nicotinic acid mononucleotide adenylyltransferase